MIQRHTDITVICNSQCYEQVQGSKDDLRLDHSVIVQFTKVLDCTYSVLIVLRVIDL